MMAEIDEAPTFKLFGTVITKEEKRLKDREADSNVAPPPPPPPSPPQSLSQGSTLDAEAAARMAASAAALPCPRCKSKETKFCYFNNYNVNQPRHFCKACHRYWTAGGTLRNVPIGAGRRRGRPAAAGGVGRGGATSIGAMEYASPPPYMGQRWLLRPEAPARSDHGFSAGMR